MLNFVVVHHASDAREKSCCYANISQRKLYIFHHRDNSDYIFEILHRECEGNITGNLVADEEDCETNEVEMRMGEPVVPDV